MFKTKVVNFCVPNDHSAVTIFLKFKKINQNKITCTNNIDRNVFLDDGIKEIFNLKLENNLKEHFFDSGSNKINYNTFSKSDMSTAKEVASNNTNESIGWYNFSKKIIDLLMSIRSESLDLIHQGSLSVEQAKIMAKDARNNLKDSIFQAKANWSSHLANHIHDLANYPKDEWKAIKVDTGP